MKPLRGAELGFDSGAYTFGYIATWAAGGEEAIRRISASGQRISAATRRILDELDTMQARREAALAQAA